MEIGNKSKSPVPEFPKQGFYLFDDKMLIA